MRSRFKLESKMVQALTILSALQLFSEGVPGVDASGEPYGLSRGMVEGAARAGASLNPQHPRELRPGMPALSQITPTSAPSVGDGLDGRGDGKVLELPLCNGQRGVIRYERIVDVRLSSSDDTRRTSSLSDANIIRSSEIPNNVLFNCQNNCLKDEISSNGRSQLCGSIDFIPGQRYTKHHHNTVQYTESKCFLTMPSRSSKFVPAKNFYHYREVCYSGEKNSAQSGMTQPPTIKECPERMYVIERVIGKRFMPKGHTPVYNITSLEDCEQICLNQAAEDSLKATSICRAGTYHKANKLCYLSSFTRRTHTFELIDDANFDYFENTCLNEQRRCPPKKLFWTKEVNAELIGPFDFQIYQNMTLENCRDKCLSSKDIFCRSVEYDERLKTCVLSDEDSVSKSDHIKRSVSDSNIYLELTCIDGNNVEPSNFLDGDNTHTLDRQHLSDRNHREVQTAFQLFRNRRLELSPGFHEDGRVGYSLSLAECLDACLEETTFQCRSVIYSHNREVCRLSEFDQINGNLQYETDFHYFENLMSGRRDDSSFNSLANRGGNRFGVTNTFNNRFDDGANQGTNNFGGFTGGNRFSQSQGGQSSTGIPLPPFGNRGGAPFQSAGAFQSGGSFQSGGTFGQGNSFNQFDNSNQFGSSNQFGNSDQFGNSNKFGSDGRRGESNSNFGSFEGGSAFGTFNNRRPDDNRGGDKFSNALNTRFHENRLGGGSGSSFESNSRVSSGHNRPGGSFNTRLTGVDLFAGGLNYERGSNSGAIGFNRRGESGSGGSRFSSFGSSNSGSPGFNSLNSFGFGTGSQGSNAGSNFGSNSGSNFGSNFGGTSGSNFGSNFGGTSGSNFGGTSGSNFGGTSGSSFVSRFGSSSGSNFGGNNVARPSGNTIIDNRTQVSQKCHTDGSMEFMLRTAEPFRGRIYTYGYYERCFNRGKGSTVNMLRITPEREFPNCGTVKYADTTSNIVVVQFADGVMTTMDKTYNLTCTTRRSGDTVVTSDPIGSSPTGISTIIEYLPEESRLESQVRLKILHGGRSATTVAVGDPLTFRIESMVGRGVVSDIFATNVIAKDPRSGRAILLIDDRGCPAQQQVFPALGKARSGDGLETRFSAFKIPGSHMIVFEAKVRMCRRECVPARCDSGRGRSETYSYGKRRRRSVSIEENKINETEELSEVSDNDVFTTEDPTYYDDDDDQMDNEFEDEDANVNEFLRVYLREEDAQIFRDVEVASTLQGACIASSQYYSLLSALLVSVICLLISVFMMAFCYRKSKKLASKNAMADDSNPQQKSRSIFPGSHPRTVTQPARQVFFPSRDDRGHSTIDLDSRKDRFSDPSEPIYTDPTLFERSPETSREEASARL